MEKKSLKKRISGLVRAIGDASTDDSHDMECIHELYEIFKAAGHEKQAAAYKSMLESGVVSICRRDFYATIDRLSCLHEHLVNLENPVSPQGILSVESRAVPMRRLQGHDCPDLSYGTTAYNVNRVRKAKNAMEMFLKEYTGDTHKCEVVDKKTKIDGVPSIERHLTVRVAELPLDENLQGAILYLLWRCGLQKKPVVREQTQLKVDKFYFSFNSYPPLMKLAAEIDEGSRAGDEKQESENLIGFLTDITTACLAKNPQQLVLTKPVNPTWLTYKKDGEGGASHKVALDCMFVNSTECCEAVLHMHTSTPIRDSSLLHMQCHLESTCLNLCTDETVPPLQQHKIRTGLKLCFRSLCCPFVSEGPPTKRARDE